MEFTLLFKDHQTKVQYIEAGWRNKTDTVFYILLLFHDLLWQSRVFQNKRFREANGKPVFYEMESQGLSSVTPGPNQGHGNFFSTCRKFPQAIPSVVTPLRLLIPFNTTTNSHFLPTVAVSLFKRLGWFAVSCFTWHSTPLDEHSGMQLISGMDVAQSPRVRLNGR